MVYRDYIELLSTAVAAAAAAVGVRDPKTVNLSLHDVHPQNDGAWLSLSPADDDAPLCCVYTSHTNHGCSLDSLALCCSMAVSPVPSSPKFSLFLLILSLNRGGVGSKEKIYTTTTAGLYFSHR